MMQNHLYFLLKTEKHTHKHTQPNKKKTGQPQQIISNPSESKFVCPKVDAYLQASSDKHCTIVSIAMSQRGVIPSVSFIRYTVGAGENRRTIEDSPASQEAPSKTWIRWRLLNVSS